jgi:hypothetical protein
VVDFKGFMLGVIDMPRGGSRPGTGRKPKDAAAASLHGSRQRALVRFPTPQAAVSPAIRTAVDPPTDLPSKARRVWEALAPFAHEKLTLYPETAAAFAMLCRAVVTERKLAKGKTEGGSAHRGMMQRVEAGYLRFGLAPNGKPILKPAPVAADPFAEFDAATR